MATIIPGKNPNKPYTVRYHDNGRQRERSFAKRRGPGGADEFKAKVEHDTRAGIFVDPKIAGEKFRTVAERWLARHPGRPRTITHYRSVLKNHILPAFGDRPLNQVANDREGVEEFLSVTLPAKGLGPSAIRTCHMVITSVVYGAIKAGRLNSSRLEGIPLPELARKAEVPFASHAQVAKLAAELPRAYRLAPYLMRGCGLRLGEALGVRGEDIRNGTLRLSRQLTPDGNDDAPLKHRGADDHRDIPVPQYVLDQIEEGWQRFPGISQRQFRRYFNRARDVAGLPSSFTPHTLRHIFASVCLAGGIPITDVSAWLGHRDINVTFAIYGHLVPASWDRARTVLDEEWRS